MSSLTKTRIIKTLAVIFVEVLASLAHTTIQNFTGSLSMNPLTYVLNPSRSLRISDKSN